MAKMSFLSLFDPGSLRTLAHHAADCTPGNSTIPTTNFAKSLGLLEGLEELAKKNLEAKPFEKDGKTARKLEDILKAAQTRRVNAIGMLVSEGLLDNLVQDNDGNAICFMQIKGLEGGIGRSTHTKKGPSASSSGVKKGTTNTGNYPTEDFVSRLAAILEEKTAVVGSFVTQQTLAIALGCSVQTLDAYKKAIAVAFNGEPALLKFHQLRGAKNGYCSAETYEKKKGEPAPVRTIQSAEATEKSVDQASA